MKNLFSLALLLVSITVLSQNIVTTEPQLRAAIIENFTGIHCGFCPAGNTEVNNAITANPGRVFAIGIHSGSFATPSNEEQPDFRTSFGTALASQAGVVGFPSASVNRYVFPEYNQTGNTSISRNNYVSASQKMLAKPAYANVGFSSSFDETSRELTVDVEVYYVEKPPFGVEANYLHIAIKESNIIGYQAGGGSNYNHQRVLRHLITGQWGDKIENVEEGFLFTKSYTYTVSDEWNEENCDLVVFISETRENIINGASDSMIGGFHSGEISPDFGRIYADKTIAKGQSNQNTVFDLIVLSGVNETSEFTLNFEFDAPEGWETWLEIDGDNYYETTNISIESLETKNIKLYVNPSNEIGAGNYKVSLENSNFSELGERSIELFVITDFENLLVSNSGGLSNVMASDYENIYLEIFENMGVESIGSIPSSTFEQAIKSDYLSSVQNIFYNVGHSSPVLTNTITNYFSEFIDNGGNFFIAGQNIGWDIMSTGGNTTAMVHKQFFQNYLSAAYVSKGNENNNVVFFSEHHLFKGLDGLSLYDPYDAELSPDVIVAINNGTEVAIFDNDRTAAIKTELSNSKVIYLNFGLEQIVEEEVRTEVLNKVYKWFVGEIGQISNMNNDTDFLTIYPNPASENINIELSDFSENSVVSIYSTDGKKVLSTNITSTDFSINISELPAGLYHLKLNAEDKVFIKRFVKKK